MTDLEAANKALVLLGVSPVGSLSDDTQAARTVNRMLEPAKRAVLSEFAWSFALKLQALVPVTTMPPPGFSFAFAIPSDAENIVQVYRGRLHVESVRYLRTTLSKVNFILSNNIISTNTSECSVEYTYVNTVLSTWSDAAQEAFCTRLAADCAATLTGGQQTGTLMLQKYQYLITNAIARSASSEDFAQPQETHYIDARW